MSSSPRIPPLPVEDWPPEAHEAYGVLRSSATRALGGSSNMTMTLAHHPKLEKAFYTFGRHLLLESTVPDRLRELATLRVAVRQQCDYEWCHHVRFGLRIGLTDSEIEAVKQGPEAALWGAADRAVLRAVDQLCGSNRLDEAAFADLAVHLDRQQLMDLVFTIGQYAMLGWAVAAFGVQVESGFEQPNHPLA